MVVEKEQTRINKELELQVIYERRQKAHDEITKQRRTKLERMVKELFVEK